MPPKKTKARTSGKVKTKVAAKAKATPQKAAKLKQKPAAKPVKLTDFLVGLSKNPKQLESYKSDPQGTMKKARVSKKDMDVLLTRDGKKIRQHLGDDYPPGCIIDFI